MFGRRRRSPREATPVSDRGRQSATGSTRRPTLWPRSPWPWSCSSRWSWCSRWSRCKRQAPISARHQMRSTTTKPEARFEDHREA